MRKERFTKKDIIAFMGMIVIFLCIMGIVGQVTRYYSRGAYVEYNNGEELVFTDIRGHMWGWTIEDKEDFSLAKGDKVILKFDTNGTEENVEDDILIQITKE